MTAMLIRPLHPDDAAALWAVIAPTIREGETCAIPRDLGEAAAVAEWFTPDKEAFVAEAGGEVVGAYYMRTNQAGGGDHVCNCGYMVAPHAAGRGVARAMAAHSLEHARARGYRAMQFNFVVSTNTRAVRLWRSLGFEIVGRVPGAFRRPDGRYVDTLVMFQAL